MPGVATPIIDMHVHVALAGDEHPELGAMSRAMRSSLAFRIFLLYARIAEHEVCDRVLRETALRTIGESGLDQVVCLALDPVHDERGVRQPGVSHLWVANEYVQQLRAELPDRILFGASVHPFDPNFERRVRAYVDDGAVLLKWIPSAQRIDLADARVGERLRFLATAGATRGPLPLLLHVGPEYAIPPAEAGTVSFDFLSWSAWEGLRNRLRPPSRRWHVPDSAGIDASLRSGLDAGATIIFAHCGLPFYATGPFGRLLEHSDFAAVSRYLHRYRGSVSAGRCLADVSACCTPLRRLSFAKIASLPEDTLVFGSDFPVPIFELSAGPREWWSDFKAIMAGRLDRAIVPQDNLLDVNLRELRLAFQGHPMFTRFADLMRTANDKP